MNLAWQFAGAVLILLPFGLYQAGRLTQHSAAYLVLNLVGSAILTAIALGDGQWGFVLVQGVWTLGAAWGLVRRPRSRAAPR